MVNNVVYVPKKILSYRKIEQEILQQFVLVQEDYQEHVVRVKFDLATI